MLFAMHILFMGFSDHFHALQTFYKFNISLVLDVGNGHNYILHPHVDVNT